MSSEQPLLGGELVFLQPTPFCNIACDYCYLPARGDRARMSFETLANALRFVQEVGCASGVFCLIWHLGEPLVVPIDWYREAHQLCAKVFGDKAFEIYYQTNATLLTPQWVDFIRSDPRIHVGISIDGPAFLHDTHRKGRDKKGSHAQAMKGISLLKNAGITFDCIAVVTRDALDYPDEFFDFFVELGPRMLSINAENTDGVNLQTSLSGSEVEQRYRRFLRRIADLHLREQRFTLRNFLWAELQLKAIAEGRDPARCNSGNRLNIPWKIISIDWQGNLQTFSPSLLGTEIPGVGASLGNVNHHRLEELRSSNRFRQLSARIEKGVELCRRGCSHFEHCGGGSPAHRWFEHGQFEIAETAYCRLEVQASWDQYLDAATEMVPQ
jgi:uncharacterized protein